MPLPRKAPVSWLPLALLGLTCLHAQDFTAKCVSVTDGDTITVLVGAEQMKIRLEGVDTPETGQDFANRAKQFTSRLVFGKHVHILPKEKDRYGRLVARVQVEGKDVSLELVKAGLAWHYKRYSSDPGLAAAEQQARAEEVGVWSLADPLPPWEQRRGSSGTWERTVESSSQSGAVYHGNVSSRIYHDPGCRYYNCKNCTREFRSKEEAHRADYRAQGVQDLQALTLSLL